MVPHMILLFPQIFLCSTLNPSWGPCIDSRNIVRTIQILRFIKMLAIVVTQILYKKIQKDFSQKISMLNFESLLGPSTLFLFGGLSLNSTDFKLHQNA